MDNNKISDTQLNELVEYRINGQEGLASQLYEDLKEKYIVLQQHNIILWDKERRVSKKLARRNDDLFPLRFGRKQFNFALTIAEKKVTKILGNTKLTLEESLEIIKVIKAIRQPPITKENKFVKINLEKEDDKQ